jgi:hypothetical protein
MAKSQLTQHGWYTFKHSLRKPYIFESSGSEIRFPELGYILNISNLLYMTLDPHLIIATDPGALFDGSSRHTIARTYEETTQNIQDGPGHHMQILVFFF